MLVLFLVLATALAVLLSSWRAVPGRVQLLGVLGVVNLSVFLALPSTSATSSERELVDLLLTVTVVLSIGLSCAILWEGVKATRAGLSIWKPLFGFLVTAADLPPGTSPLSKLDLGPFEVHSMV